MPQIIKHIINNMVLTFNDYYLSWYIKNVTNHLGWTVKYDSNYSRSKFFSAKATIFEKPTIRGYHNTQYIRVEIIGIQA